MNTIVQQCRPTPCITEQEFYLCSNTTLSGPSHSRGKLNRVRRSYLHGIDASHFWGRRWLWESRRRHVHGKVVRLAVCLHATPMYPSSVLCCLTARGRARKARQWLIRSPRICHEAHAGSQASSAQPATSTMKCSSPPDATPQPHCVACVTRSYHPSGFFGKIGGF